MAMTIEQILAAKMETETAIRDLLVRFSETTGLVVHEVNFSMTDITSYGDKQRRITCTAVEMDVRLP